MGEGCRYDDFLGQAHLCPGKGPLPATLFPHLVGGCGFEPRQVSKVLGLLAGS